CIDHLSNPGKDKYVYIEAFKAHTIVKATAPFGSGRTQDDAIILSVNLTIPILVFYSDFARFGAEGCCKCSVFSLPDADLFIIIINIDRVTDKPAVSNVIHSTGNQFQDLFFVFGESNVRSPGKTICSDVGSA